MLWSKESNKLVRKLESEKVIEIVAREILLVEGRPGNSKVMMLLRSELSVGFESGRTDGDRFPICGWYDRLESHDFVLQGIRRVCGV